MKSRTLTKAEQRAQNRAQNWAYQAAAIERRRLAKSAQTKRDADRIAYLLANPKTV